MNPRDGGKREMIISAVLNLALTDTNQIII